MSLLDIIREMTSLRDQGIKKIAEIGVGRIDVAFGALYWHNETDGIPDYEIMMFEPHPLYHRMLDEAGGYKPNVELYNVAIGDEEGEMQLVDAATSSHLQGISSPISQKNKKDELTGDVYTVKVEKISKYDKGDIDYLRVDTEGNEWFALKHLISRPKMIVVETHNNEATYINPYLFEIQKWAAENNYQCVSIQEGDHVFVKEENTAA